MRRLSAPVPAPFAHARALLWLVCAFSSACLLFVVQPLLAKWLLPSFGGSPGTWAACMLFFQAWLLIGYGYAWLIGSIGRRAPRAACGVHGLLVLAVMGFALVAPSLATPEASALSPGVRIPWLLLVQAGLPYLLLASTAPLLQAWAAQLGVAVPHRLYAVSNAGSLLALIAYPWLIEGAWEVRAQYAAWLWGALVFAPCSLLCAGVTARAAWLSPVVVPPTSRFTAAFTARERLYWLFCSFVPSLFLLAATNAITIDLAATPTLWVLPLALYLLSFIAAFSGMTERMRSVLLAGWVLASLGLGYGAFAEGSAGLYMQLGCVLGGFTLAALLCHDALVRARPLPSQLPAFYWWSALGGVLGGAYVNWLAPRCFSDYYELELAALLTYVVLLWARSRQRRALGESAAERGWLFLGIGLSLPLLTVAMLMRAGVDYQGSRSGRVLERRRSWFGALRVTQLDVGRMLTHGRIRHGMQLADPARAHWPTMYFGRGTAVAQILGTHGVGRPRELGVVGLGIGTLAVYGRPGDNVTFYELDPDVLDVAQRFFSFLRDSPARVHFVLGDGRLSLARGPARRFDVLVLDAFASDAVPAHLLTREAFALYVRHLAPDGVLLANVSNRHLAVDRVVRAAAAGEGLACAVVQTPFDVEHFVSKVRWAVMARTQAQLTRELADLVPATPSGPDVLWTDARASLWSIVK